MKRAQRLRSLLRDLVRELGFKELSRRTGIRVTRAVLEGERIPGPLAKALRDVETRRERARAMARARQLRKTRITEDVEPKELADAAGVTLRTAKRWIQKGGAPKHARDVSISLAMGEKPYPEPARGTGKAPREDFTQAGQAMRDFVRVVRNKETIYIPQAKIDRLAKKKDEKGKSYGEKRARGILVHREISKVYARWRAAKDKIRGKVTRQRWKAFIERMGGELDLPEVGVFSKERFRKS